MDLIENIKSRLNIPMAVLGDAGIIVDINKVIKKFRIIKVSPNRWTENR